jgi:hypothetical protein
LRLRAAGVQIRYDPEAVADQHYGKTLEGLLEDSFDKGVTAVQFASRRPAALSELRLGSVSAAGRVRRAARASLLPTVERRRAAAGRIAEKLERTPLRRRKLFYAAASDVFFWAGAASALGHDSLVPDLERIRKELGRGPVDLLLHG